MVPVGLLVGLGAGFLALVSFGCDILSEDEKRKQADMRADYDCYKQRKEKEYRAIQHHYRTAQDSMREGYEAAIEEYNRQLIEERKAQNSGIFERTLAIWDGQHEDKAALLKDCEKAISLCEKSARELEQTYTRFKSLQATAVSLQEVQYKLEAYQDYLERYKQAFVSTYNNSGEILPPFSMTLPQDYPYTGKLLYLNHNDLDRGYCYHYSDQAGGICLRLDKSDIQAYQTACGRTDGKLPFMVKRVSNGRWYLSFTKGQIRNSIGGTAGLDMEVLKILSNKIYLQFQNQEFPQIWIDKRDLKDYRRRTPIGSTLHVYVKEYDFALNGRIRVSEKIGESFTIAQFMNIAMVFSGEEKNTLYQSLADKKLLQESDEWRIGPLYDGENVLTGVIMQIRNSFAYRASFAGVSGRQVQAQQKQSSTEELANLAGQQLVLRYEGLLDKKDYLTFDKEYVATNITVDCYNLDTIQEAPDNYWALYQECSRFYLYLASEFASQSRILANSPMNLYLAQWTEVMRRLIEAKEYGKKFTVQIAGYHESQLSKSKKWFTLLEVEPRSGLEAFCAPSKKTGPKKFFISLHEPGKEKIASKAIFDEDGKLILKIQTRIGEEILLNSAFQLDMYVHEIPYPERQQFAALSAFREGRVVSEAVKEAVIDTANLQYMDNGYRINKLSNNRIQENQAQLDAVIRAFSAEHFFMIQGPPGTGKTTVIQELILQQLKRNHNSRILVVSQANVAVDNVLRGVVKSSFVDLNQIVRCGSEERIAEDLASLSFEGKWENYTKTLKEDDLDDPLSLTLRRKWLEIVETHENADIVGECLLKCFQVIGATCVGLVSRKYGLAGTEFDLVIIDEAGKALVGELLIPINQAKKVIIIGDHKQLPPVIDKALYSNNGQGAVDYSDVVDQDEQVDFLNKSFFQRLYENCPDELKCMLNIQFRMPPVIADLVNMFYDGKLLTGENCSEKQPIFLNNHLIFVDMKDVKDYKENDASGRSPRNPKEVEALYEIIKKLRVYYQGRIVVITPYKGQKYEILKFIREKKLAEIRVDTIDAFQGDEENIVIYCTTRATTPTKYFSDNARLNVAFSRAKNTLIMLASSKYFKSYKDGHILRDVSAYLERHASVIPYGDWIADDFDLQFNPSWQRTPEDSGQQLEKPLFSIDHTAESFFKTIQEKKDKEEEADKTATCAACGRSLSEGEDTLCYHCISGAEPVTCKCCGSSFSFSYWDKYVAKKKPPVLCSKCEEVPCEHCGAPVLIRKSVKNDIKSKGGYVVCKNCRSVRCRGCGTWFTMSKSEFTMRQKQHRANLCENCVELKCISCKKTFYVPQSDIYLYANYDGILCDDCERVVCSKCGQTFFRKKSPQTACVSEPVCDDCNQKIRVGACEGCGRDVYKRKWEIELTTSSNRVICDRCEEVACSACGNWFVMPKYKKRALQENGKSPLCPECLEHIQVCCDGCGDLLDMMRAQYNMLRKSGKRIFCAKCREPEFVGICKDCFEELYMPHWKVLEYKAKGFNMPVRCQKCKEKRKAEHGW